MGVEGGGGGEVEALPSHTQFVSHVASAQIQYMSLVIYILLTLIIKAASYSWSKHL